MVHQCIFVVVLLLLLCVVHSTVPSSENNVLVSLYNNCNGNRWKYKSGWNVGDPCEGTWYGVVCDSTNSSVISLALPNNNISCTGFPNVTGLTQIQKLDLSINNLNGNIPDFSSLTQLNYLDLSETGLTGTIPTSLASLTSLQFLNLGVMHFPLSDWTNRIYRGIITPIFKQNKLTGSIPVLFTQLVNLKVLNLAFNSLTGTIPDLSSCSQLQEIALHSNLGITGTIPTWLGSLPNIEVINLYTMGLNQGTIPVSISNCAKLTYLALGRHYSITGNIPTEFNKLVNLRYVMFGWMGLSGAIPDLSALTKLEYFHAGSNAFTGEIPNWVTGLTSLQKIFLFSNKLTGVLPSGFGDIISLQSIIMYDNQFTGPIPESYSKLTNLTQLAINTNKMEGTIPSFLGNLPKLGVFLFNANNFHGEIPSSLCNLPFMSQLVGSSNKLTGSIPPCLLTSFPSVTLLQFQNNQLTGSIPPIGNLASLQSLLLGNNDFDPTPVSSLEFGNLKKLTGLGMSGTKLYGDFPSSLCSITTLTSIALANNKLTGTVPSCISNTIMNYIDLSNNTLSGEFPNPPITISTLDLKANQFVTLKTIDYGNSLSALKSLDMSSNSISRPLEEMLSAVQRAPLLSELSYANNEIGGSMTTGSFYYLVPAQGGTATFLGFPSIIKLLLGNNKITGVIHPALSLLTSMQTLELSNNNLQGTVPSLGTRLTLVDFRGNSGLFTSTGDLPPFVTYVGTPYVKDNGGTFSCPTLGGSNSLTIYLDAAYYNNTLCHCEPYFYGSNGICTDCLEHATCPGGASPSPMIINAGYFPSPSSENPLEIIECQNLDPTSTSCNPKNSSVFECSPGYTDRLCSRCNTGFYRSGNDCITCSGSLQWLPLTALIVVAIVIYLALIIPSYSIGSSNIIRILVFYIQTASLITNIGFPWPSAFKALASVSSGFSVKFDVLKCLATANFTYYEQTILVYVLPPGFFILFLIEWAIIKILKLRATETTTRPISAKRSMINVTAFDSTSTSTEMETRKETSSASSVADLESNVSSDAFIYTPSDSVRSLYHRILYAFLNLLSLVYLPATSQTISYFNCRDDPYLGPYMDKVPYISCHDPEFLRYRNASIALFIIYGLGIPLLFTYLLHKYVRGNIIADKGNVSHWFGFFYLPFKPRFYFYGLLLFIRSWLLLLVLGFVDQKNPIITLIAAIILVGSFMFHQNARALYTVLENFLESLSLAGLIVLFTSGLMFQSFSNTYGRENNIWGPVLGVLGTIVAVPPILTAICGLLMTPPGKYLIKRYLGVKVKALFDAVCKPQDLVVNMK